MFKRVISLVIIICLFASYQVTAENNFTIKPDGNFVEYKIGDDESDVADILGVSEETFSNLCKEKSIIYFAVNSENTKQIQITCSQNEFSNSVGNISDLSDDKIFSLMSGIVGSDNIKGEIVTKDNQKFIKTKVASSDSGGEYTVIEYITVAGKINYTLSFLTSSGEKTEYTEKSFETYDTKDFYQQGKTTSALKYIIPAGIVIFTLACIFIIYTLIRDIKKPSSDITEDNITDSAEDSD